jgi:hypothetical protein
MSSPPGQEVRMPAIAQFANSLRELTSTTTLSLSTVVGDTASRSVTQKLQTASSHLSAVESHLTSLTPEQRLALYDAHSAGALQPVMHDVPHITGGTGDYADDESADAPRYSGASPAYLESTAIFAQRSLQAIGCHATLLLEKNARCDDCHDRIPGVVDYCRNNAGCRICFICDSVRHKAMQCLSQRWCLKKMSIDGDGTCGKRARDLESYFPYQLKPNEFIECANSDCASLTDPVLIQNRGKMHE